MDMNCRVHAVSAGRGGTAPFFCRGAFAAASAPVGSPDELENLPPGSYTAGATEFDKDSDGKLSVCFNSDDTNTAWELLKKYPDAELVLNDYRGFHGRDLDILRDHTGLRHLQIACGHIQKQGMTGLRALESLTVNEWNRDVDLGAFPQLRTFRGDCPKRMPKRMDELRTLALWGYSGSDLAALPEMPNLRSLQLTQCGIRSFSGCDRFPELREIAVAHCRRLADAAELRKIRLQWFSIVSCAKLNALYELLTAQTGLLGLELEGGIVLPDLEFLAGMPHLGYLWLLVSDIADGDLRRCRDIPIVNYRNRRHYRPSFDELPPLEPQFEPLCHSGTTLANLAARLGITLDMDRRELAALSDRYFGRQNATLQSRST